MTDHKDTNIAAPADNPFWRRKRFLVPSVLILLVVLLFARVAIAPVSIGFVDDLVRSQFEAQNQSGEFALAFAESGVQLVGGVRPTIKLKDVTLTDKASGATMSADEVGVAWYGGAAISGAPAYKAHVEAPVIQLVQDYSGIRLAKIEVADEGDGLAVVRLSADSAGADAIRVTNDGVVSRTTDGDGAAAIKSDNAWAIEGVEALEDLLSRFSKTSQHAAFSEFTISNAQIEIVDRIYQLYRQLNGVEVRLRPDDDAVAMKLAFSTPGRSTTGEMIWTSVGDKSRQITGWFDDVDLALLMPFLDDQDGMFALKGGTNMRFDVDFGTTGVELGAFEIDLTPAKAAILTDQFVISAEPALVRWYPKDAKYVLDPYQIEIGQSSTTVAGEFRLGLDESFGPTVGFSVSLKDTKLHPNDLGAPENNIDLIMANGWSAPLYGALGLDAIAFRDDQFEIDGRGRIDVLQSGLGFDLALFGEGASADDLKRIWPYFLATDARDWFVENITGGRIENARMRFNFPVGTVGKPGEDRRIPDGGVSIEGTARDVNLIPLPGFPTIQIDGTTRISVKDHHLELGFDEAIVRDDSGEVVIQNAAYLNRDSGAKEQLFELSGRLKGALPTLIAIADREPLNLLDDFELQYAPEDLAGEADVQVIATISQDEGGKPKGVDYSLSGTVQEFASTKPIEGYVVADGSASFTASQQGYRISGNANVGGVRANVRVESDGRADPVVTASATMTEKDREALGIDLSQFVEGPLRFVGRPVGELIQVAVDLTDARLKFAELGIDKKPGVKGELKATLLLDEKLVDAQTLDLRFEDVRALGSLQYDIESGLQSADIVELVLNEGDRASVSMAPIEGGYSVKVIGEQLDLKPMLKRFLGLGEGASNQATSNVEDQIIDIRVDLDRALGFYKTTAYDLSSHIVFKGADFTRVDLQTSLGNTNVASIATNPVPNGRLMSAATNDLGTLLRFIGLYSRLLNGEASLALTIDTKDKRNSGEFKLTDFSLVDEDKVAQVLGNHRDSRELIERGNRVNFREAYLKFSRQGEVITVEESSLDGGTIGGTLRGAIYTNSRQYDLVGTYIPLFGLNNIFQKLPLLGRILGGRDGEGLIGVTFAIRGELDNPQFAINPASILAPGVFRQLFEFRAQRGDEAAKKALEAVDAGQNN